MEEGHSASVVLSIPTGVIALVQSLSPSTSYINLESRLLESSPAASCHLTTCPPQMCFSCPILPLRELPLDPTDPVSQLDTLPSVTHTHSWLEVAVSPNNNEVQIYRKNGESWTLEHTLAEVSYEVLSLR